MNLNADFEKGLLYEEYVELLEDNLPLHQKHYNKFQISPEQEETIKQIKPLKLIILTEPWCGDSLAIFPVIRRITEINGNWEMRILRRDENPELMDHFLTRNARAVPIILFLDKDGSLIFRFGPRPKAAQDIFEQYREDFKAGKIDKKEVIKKIRNFYAKNRGDAILNDLFSLFNKHNLIKNQ